MVGILLVFFFWGGNRPVFRGKLAVRFREGCLAPILIPCNVLIRYLWSPIKHTTIMYYRHTRHQHFFLNVFFFTFCCNFLCVFAFKLNQHSFTKKTTARLRSSTRKTVGFFVSKAPIGTGVFSPPQSNWSHRCAIVTWMMNPTVQPGCKSRHVIGKLAPRIFFTNSQAIFLHEKLGGADSKKKQMLAEGWATVK